MKTSAHIFISLACNYKKNKLFSDQNFEQALCILHRGTAVQRTRGSEGKACDESKSDNLKDMSDRVAMSKMLMHTACHMFLIEKELKANLHSTLRQWNNAK